jgi:hypothetical protein
MLVLHNFFFEILRQKGVLVFLVAVAHTTTAYA